MRDDQSAGGGGGGLLNMMLGDNLDIDICSKGGGGGGRTKPKSGFGCNLFLRKLVYARVYAYIIWGECRGFNTT